MISDNDSKNIDFVNQTIDNFIRDLNDVQKEITREFVSIQDEDCGQKIFAMGLKYGVDLITISSEIKELIYKLKIDYTQIQEKLQNKLYQE